MTFLFAWTLFHVVISLVGIATGFVVMYGLLTSQPLPRWTLVFLITTIATSVTGFIVFPFTKFLPSHAVGILSLLILPFAVLAVYRYRLAGKWRWIYVITALVAQWLNVFVLVAQSFNKIPALRSLAPTQSEPPFAIAEGVVFVAFLVIGVLSVKRFRPATM